MTVLTYETRQTGGSEAPFKEAFDQLGHTATMFDWQRYLYATRKSSLHNRLRDRLFFDTIAKRINNDVKKIIDSQYVDLFLVFRGDHVFPETVEYARNRGARTALWSTDDVFNPQNWTRFTLQTFPVYDVIFSPRGHLRDEYLRRGARSFEEINWYYRSGLLLDRPDFDGHQYQFDVSFVGSWSKRREFFLEALQEYNVDIWGWGWRKRANPRFLAQVRCHEQIPMHKMMEVFSKSKININILTSENRDTTNLRNFEIAAAGAFQLSERSPAIQVLFHEGAEIVCFDSTNELQLHCARYLHDDAVRESIAIRGYDRVVSGHHGIVDRAKQIVDWTLRS